MLKDAAESADCDEDKSSKSKSLKTCIGKAVKAAYKGVVIFNGAEKKCNFMKCEPEGPKQPPGNIQFIVFH